MEALRKIRSIIFQGTKEDFFVYFLFGPSWTLYILFDRFPAIYAISCLYVLYCFVIKSVRVNINYDRTFLFSLSLYFFYSIISILYHDIEFSSFAWTRDVAIIIFSLLPFVFRSSFREAHVKFLFLLTSFSYFLWILIGLFYSQYSQVNATRWITEFDMGLFFGIFVYYFGFKRIYTWMFCAFLVSFLVSKRGVIVGFSFTGLIGVIMSLTSDRNKLINRRVLIGFLFTSMGVFSFYMLDIVKYIIQIIGKNPTDVDKFLNGRAGVLSLASFKIATGSIFQTIFGRGPGQLDSIVTLFRPVPWARYFGVPTNPHNDFLKILYDYGLVGFGLFGYFYTLIFTYRKVGLYIGLYMFVLFLVDNPFIHVYFNLLVYVVMNSDAE